MQLEQSLQYNCTSILQHPYIPVQTDRQRRVYRPAQHITGHLGHDKQLSIHKLLLEVACGTTLLLTLVQL